jgi:hypothetical protein
MNPTIKFHFGYHQIHAASDDDGTAWFVASEIASILSYRRVSDLMRGVEPGNKGVRNGQVTVSEFGVFPLLQRTMNPGAKMFRRWLLKHVLPEVARVGAQTPAPLEPEPEPAPLSPTLMSPIQVFADTLAAAKLLGVPLDLARLEAVRETSRLTNRDFSFLLAFAPAA